MWMADAPDWGKLNVDCSHLPGSSVEDDKGPTSSDDIAEATVEANGVMSCFLLEENGRVSPRREAAPVSRSTPLTFLRENHAVLANLLWIVCLGLGLWQVLVQNRPAGQYRSSLVG
jgi:hypothetical protein